MNLNDAIAFNLERSRGLLMLFLSDLTPADFLHRPTPAANCAAWILGHLIPYERRALTLLNQTDVPSLPDGFEKRFGRDEASAQAVDFGDVSHLPGLFDQYRLRLINAVKHANPDQFNQPLDKPTPRFSTLGEMLLFFPIHTAMHAGQISTIRRSLGRPPLM